MDPALAGPEEKSCRDRMIESIGTLESAERTDVNGMHALEKPKKCTSVFRRHRVDEYLFAIFLWILALIVYQYLPVFKQDIPAISIETSTPIFFARDPSIDRKLGTETVPDDLLIVLVSTIPIAVHLAIVAASKYSDKVRKLEKDTRNFFLGLLLSGASNFFVTSILKKATGRLRPCFYDLCGWDHSIIWDGVTNLCRSEKEVKARMSFPSGHASTAFCAYFYLTLYLLGRFRLFPAPRPQTRSAVGGFVQLLFMCMAFVPTVLATGIAISRVTDNYHHPSDILAGAAIGVVTASVAYFWSYGSFGGRSETAGVPFEELVTIDHRARYCNDLP